MKAPLALLAMLAAANLAGQTRVVALRSQAPLVTFRIVFLAGAASDPAAKPGLASLTAAMLSQGGSREMTYKQILDAMFPMATSVSSQVDKEMTVFSATTHVDNLEAFYRIFRAMLLDPGWRQDDFSRLRDDAINFLRVSLRGNNDEELGKEVLYNEIYAGHLYGHHNVGTAGSLQKITLEDLRGFYRTHYGRDNLILGIAGGYPESFLERMKKDFGKLPARTAVAAQWKEPAVRRGIQVTMIEKDTRSVAYSIGFPISVRRGHPDYPALLLAQAYFGQHRTSGGRLYDRMRELRGLNYGDYAYIEYFPRGMFQFEPDPNLGRRGQIFQIWIRPVEPPTAHFALRLALYELDKLIREGIPRESFERWRTFASKYVNLLTKTKDSELGYAIDSLYYGIPGYNRYVKESLAKLTVDDVNKAIRKHLDTGDIQIVVVAKNCEDLRKRLVSNEVSPMLYNSAKPKEVLEEDKLAGRFRIELKPDAVKIVLVDTIFE
jgi:zinc protease